ncbi:hypothetical protein PAMP_008843 [Pampus punctatissimus]
MLLALDRCCSAKKETAWSQPGASIWRSASTLSSWATSISSRKRPARWDSEAGVSQRSKNPSPSVDTPARGQPPPPWVADSPPKSSAAAEAPAGLVTAAPTTAAQFPKDQDLRFSHGAAR